MAENTKYKATIGLEIHAELKTQTKMFCSCKNDPDEEKPNSNICEVCTAQPGTLPVLNKKAIEHVLRVGIACCDDKDKIDNIADFTEWDRKNYFYPDIPKGYQITQYKYPLVKGGSIKGVQLTRIHLEEDTGSSTHDAGDFSLVNFNRAGVPLMELVTEPVIHSGKQAADFAKELQLLLQYLGAGDANMEKGEMRVEANISVSATDKLGTKAEIKNLNSFRTVERAIAYEIERQIDALEKGEKLVQETRGWDEAKQKTYSQRIKEDSHDYRYFPDPDLPKMMISEVFDLKSLKEGLPELPWERRDRLNKIDNRPAIAEMYIQDIKLGNTFNSILEEIDRVFNGDVELKKLASNYVSSDLYQLIKINPQKWDQFDVIKFVNLLSIYQNKKISSRGVKDLLAILYNEGWEAMDLMIPQYLIKESDEGAVKEIASKLIAENPKVVADYKAGKEMALMFFVGQIMKATKGSSNPQVIKKVLVDLLS